MQTISKQLSAVIFPFIFSACVSQSVSNLDHQAAAKVRVELALSYLQQNNPQLAKINLDKALLHDKITISCIQHLHIIINNKGK